VRLGSRVWFVNCVGISGCVWFEFKRLRDESTAFTAILNGIGECDSTASIIRVVCLNIEVRRMCVITNQPNGVPT